jgi:chitodextrinase
LDAAGNLSGYSGTSTAATTGALAPPSGLVVVASSSSEVDLAWSAAGGGSGTIAYLIERCSGANCGSYAQIGTSSSTNYDNAGLSPSTNYSYRVRASDGVGDLSPYSNSISVTTPASSPDCN